MAFPVSYLIVWHVAMPYLIQALRPLDRDAVPRRGRDQAKRRLLGRRTMPLPVKIHLPTQLTVPPRILARHVVDGVGGAGLDGLLVPRLHQRHEAAALPRIGGRAEQRLPPRRREGVAERGEDQEEEQEDGGEEGGGDKVEEAPLAGIVAFGGGEAQVAHFL